MTVGVQVSFDASDPARLGAFWAELLGYVEQPPPEGFAVAGGADGVGGARGPARQRLRHRRPGRGRSAAVLPAGARSQDGQEPRAPRRQRRRRPAGHERTAHVRAEAARGRFGATQVREAEQRGEFWVVLQDPDGNEFCLQ